MGARLVPAMLLAGVAAGVGTVAVHQSWWGLLLGAAVTLLVVVATPPGWGTRLPYAIGFVAVVALVTIPRGEGDYLLGDSLHGYAVLALALVVLMAAIATLPRPGRRNPRLAEESAASQ